MVTTVETVTTPETVEYAEATETSAEEVSEEAKLAVEATEAERRAKAQEVFLAQKISAKILHLEASQISILQNNGIKTVADFKPGSGHKVFRLKNYPSFGALICYEIIFPSQIINKKDKPQFLINLTNDGWYGNSAGPYQHLVTTRLRAAEEGITIVRAANTGISAVISPTGTVISFLALNFRGITDVRLPKKLSVPTFYGRYGNFIPLTFCFMNILLAFFLKNRLN